MVDHSGTMEDVPVPVFTGRLILCEVGAGHLDKSMPDAFNEAVGTLYFGRVCDDVGLVVVYTYESLYPNEFSIEVGVDSLGNSDGVIAELGEGVDDLV